MKHFYLILLLCSIFLFGHTGCTSESDILDNVNHSNQIPVSFAITDSVSNTCPTRSATRDMVLDNSNPSVIVSMEEMPWEDEVIPLSRTSWTTANNKVVWTTNDRIGIYMRSAAGGSSYYDKSNVPYSIVSGGSSSGTLTPAPTPIYFPDQVTHTKFFAYYPYSASAGNSHTAVAYTLPANQSDTGISGADVMCSNTPIANGAAPNVALNFNHKMVLLTFRVNTTSSLLSSRLTGIKLTGTSVTNAGTIDLTTATVTPNTAVSFSPSVTTDQKVAASTYAYVDMIINPCTISNNLGGKFKVILSFSGLLDHDTILVTDATFVAGTRYVYNLTVTLSL